MKISAQNPVAYFSAEYGIEARLPIYAGGLGVLSGDHIKAASDMAYNLVAVGLLYKGEGAAQEIDETGRQIEKNWDFDPLSVGLEHVYLNDMPLFIKISLTDTEVWARCWKKDMGNGVILYLLDTDTDQNPKNERSINSALYNGSEENIIKQQLLLGIGGVKLLHTLGIHPAVYHVNEGRPAFLHWELVISYMKENNLNYEEAVKKAKAKTVYTNHTLVSAGNQSYNINLLRGYSQYYADQMGIGIDKLLEAGMEDTQDHFVMTRFALNTSSKTNGVSALHSKLCKEHWPEYNWTNVTNGVHMPTWQKQEIRECDMQSASLWQLHNRFKREAMEYFQALTGYGYDPNRMVITWARRMAEYKRFNAIFEDVQRLAGILKHVKRPMQIIIAGKAHAKDTRAKMLLQEIIHLMQHELSGHVLYVPNYNIEIAKRLVSGSDIWLNTPVYGMEASGTSGMKAIANGVLQCTVSDGWTHEVDWEEMGWVLDPENVAEHFYDLMETKIGPEFFDRDQDGIPQAWVEKMRKSIKLSEKFSAKRMVQQYIDEMYNTRDQS